MAKRAVLYARVSYDDRATEGRNLAAQLELCRAYAQQRGYDVVAELAEDMRGARGSDLDLDKLNQILDMAEKGTFDVLIVREMDRLSRDTWKQEYIANGLDRHGCAIEYALYDFPPTPEGDLQRGMLSQFAQYEARKISQRMARGRRGRVKAGNVFVSGRPPYGYRKVEREGKVTLAPREGEAQTVRLVYQWYTTGDGMIGPLAISAIVKRLNALGIAPYSVARGLDRPDTSKGWVRSVVHRLLQSEVYAGVWTYGKDSDNPIEVQVPAIIDRETWDAAQARLAHNRQHSGRRRKYRYLVGGRVICGHCGRHVAGSGTEQHGRVYRYYACPAHHMPSGYGERCELPRFRADFVEGRVWAWLRAWLADPWQTSVGIEEYQNGQAEKDRPLQEQLATIEAKIAEKCTRYDLLIDLYLSAEIDRAAFRQRRAQFEQELQALDALQTRTEAALSERAAVRARAAGLRELVAQIGESLEAADDDPDLRERIVSALDLEVKLQLEGEERQVWVTRIADLDVLTKCPRP